MHEAGNRIRPVLGSGRYDTGIDSAKYICGSVVYYIVYTGRI